MGVLMSRAAAASSATVILCVMSALLAADRTVFAQAGSTGGVIGKQDKSISGGDETEKPRSPKTEDKPQHSRSKAARDGGTKPVSTVSGRWRWQAACGIGGQWHGEFQISEISNGSFTGSFTSDLSESGKLGSPVPQRITNGQISGDQISFAREAGGTVQHWSGTIAQASGGTRRMSGSLTGCSWTATR
jgi:hypothetical protein